MNEKVKPWTPGPWTRDHHGDLRGGDGQQVLERGSGVALACAYHEKTAAEQEANGVIRNAAPELVEALEELLDQWQNDTQRDDRGKPFAVCKARAILSRIYGDQS